MPGRNHRISQTKSLLSMRPMVVVGKSREWLAPPRASDALRFRGTDPSRITAHLHTGGLATGQPAEILKDTSSFLVRINITGLACCGQAAKCRSCWSSHACR